MLDAQRVQIDGVDAILVHLPRVVVEYFLQSLRFLSYGTSCCHEPTITECTLSDIHRSNTIIAPEGIVAVLCAHALPIKSVLV